MRLFAAVLPPPGAVAELGREVRALRRLAGADTLRWTQPDGWHFTLAFYGEVPEETVPELERRLERAAARSTPFPLALAGGGSFGRDRALWAGACGELPALGRLAERAQAAGRRAGAGGEEHRHYRAHLTLARGKGDTALRPYVDALAEFAGTAWTVGELVLVRSHLPASGVPGEQPRYAPVARWALGAAR
ncbi:RNA 2',3'-cyclic phosphodiesterase [Streptomyces seoulensis]|uniref:RNA 2',3'-cyclic phosphodiesterase n=1 Tax=Streptomyces seoulensis TaxID=73044 RepID=A0A4V0ZZH2_STRSO|nr:RNA 2',3'-cyclic phosphodiesterase [Streptomyces seoulensis]QBJ91076.1 RNA 2',3'-cyclic phosphodiesterase [Streptomyces seoulensis]